MNPNYGWDAEQTFRMEEMSPGELAMFMLHTLLASGEDKLEGLWEAQAALLDETEGGTPGHVYCRWAMQLTFAASRCIGKLLSTKEQREQQEGSVPSSAARRRGRGSTSPHQIMKSSLGGQGQSPNSSLRQGGMGSSSSRQDG